MRRLAIGSMALVLVGAACGDDGGSALQGIYQANSWTLNEGACDAEGPSVLASEPQTMFYVKMEKLLGFEFLNLNFCDDAADCEMLAGDEGTIHIGRFAFDRGNDGDGWSSKWYGGFTDMDGLCQGSFVVATLTGVEGDSVRVEVRETPAGGFPPDADGFCTDEAGEQAAQGQPCTRLEVVGATFVSKLP